MILSNILQLDTVSRDVAPTGPSPSASAGGRQVPDAWRVVLEDGSTSDDFASEPAPGAGRKLMAEVTEAVRQSKEGKRRPDRPRNIAMPSSPRQPVHALDDSTAPSHPAHDASTPSCVRTPASLNRSSSEAEATGAKSAACRLSAAGAAKEAPDILVAAPGSARRELDPRLARVMERWPHLTRGIRAAILALAEAEAP